MYFSTYFPDFYEIFPKCSGKDSFQKSQIKSLYILEMCQYDTVVPTLAHCIREKVEFILDRPYIGDIDKGDAMHKVALI